MTIYLGKSCSFGLLCVSSVDVYQFVCVLLSIFDFEGGMWDLIVKVPSFFLLSVRNLNTVGPVVSEDYGRATTASL